MRRRENSGRQSRWIRRALWWCCWLGGCVAARHVAILSADADASDAAASADADADAVKTHVAADRLLATINGRAINERHVQREIDRTLAESPAKLDAAARAALVKPTLELLVDRCVVLNGLRRDKLAAADGEVDVEIERLKTALARRKQSLDGYLTAQGQTLDDLRDELAWRLSWRRFCEAELTDDAIAAYFDTHRRQFDGTQLRVSHILFALPNDAASDAQREAIDKAAKLRARIATGEIEFADAARQFSDAPTKADGGDLGFITRRGEQHESFAAAAFALAEGEISPPTRSPYGVHLIQCTAEKPGEKKLAEVREAVVRAATTDLFRRRAKLERSKAKIVYADVNR